MSATFSITADPDRDLIRIAMSGFFTPDDIDRFVEERRRAHAQLRCAPNRHLTVNDVRGMKIQPQESVAAFQAMLADPAYRSRRLAFVVSATLAQMQLERALSGRPDTAFFEDPAKAERWLLAPEAQQAPLRRAG